MPNNSDAPLTVSALIVTRTNDDGATEILNVLAHNKDKYGFPGGKQEAGESPEDAVIRETEEELGVKPTNVMYKDTYKALTPEGRGIEMSVFIGEIPDGIKPTSEIAELHWLTYEQMVDDLSLLTPMTIEHVMPILKNL